MLAEDDVLSLSESGHWPTHSADCFPPAGRLSPDRELSYFHSIYAITESTLKGA